MSPVGARRRPGRDMLPYYGYVAAEAVVRVLPRPVACGVGAAALWVRRRATTRTERLPGAWAHSAAVSRRLQGTLRSAAFTIDRRYLHVF